MSSISIVIQTNKDASSMKQAGQKHKNVIRIIDLLKGLVSGALLGSVNIYADSADPVSASATATLATVVADNTITIGGTTLTAKASPVNESQWLVTGSDTVVAAALASCINAHSVLSKIVYATSSLGVVTISCVVPGVIGNQVPVTRVGSPITLSGAVLAGGAGGVANAPEQAR